MKTIFYKGKGEHSVNELESIIEQQAEELHLYKSGQKPTQGVSNLWVEDIRNKLSSPKNLCTMLKNREVEPFIGDDPRNEMITKEIEQTLINIEYLSNL